MRRNALFWAALVLVSGSTAACTIESNGNPGNDGGTTNDGGTNDSGVVMDGGTTDSGTDSGIDPSRRAYVRLAHLGPNAPNVRACIQEGDGLFLFDGPVPSATIASGGLAFGAFTDYVHLNTELEYAVRIYAAAALDAWNQGRTPRCPTTSDTDAPAEVLSASLPALNVGRSYTLAASGLVGENGTLPAYCGANADGACPSSVALQAVFYEDDSTPEANRVLVRGVHAVPNGPAIDICLFRRVNGELSDTAELIAENLAFPNRGAYQALDAVQDGVVTLHVSAGEANRCSETTEIGGVDFPFELSGSPGPGVTGQLAAGTIVSLYVSGLLPDRVAVAVTPMLDGN